MQEFNEEFNDAIGGSVIYVKDYHYIKPKLCTSFKAHEVKYTARPTSLLSFELIPEMKTYECL